MLRNTLSLQFKEIWLNSKILPLKYLGSVVVSCWNRANIRTYACMMPNSHTDTDTDTHTQIHTHTDTHTQIMDYSNTHKLQTFTFSRFKIK